MWIKTEDGDIINGDQITNIFHCKNLEEDFEVIARLSDGTRKTLAINVKEEKIREIKNNLWVQLGMDRDHGRIVIYKGEVKSS